MYVMVKERFVPRDNEIPDGWRPGKPQVQVHELIITALGMPRVDYDGIADLYGEFDILPKTMPIAEFTGLLLPRPGHKQSTYRYSPVFDLVQIDPLTLAILQEPSHAVVRPLAITAAIRQGFRENPFRGYLPLIGPMIYRASLDRAKNLPDFGEVYGDIVTFPGYDAYNIEKLRDANE